MYFLLLLVCVNSHLHRIPLEQNSDKHSLVQLVNTLQHQHSILLEKTHYDHIQMEEKGISVSLMETERKHLSHNHHHHHHKHIATKHIIKMDREDLWDMTAPDTIEDVASSTLQPLNKQIEQSLEAQQFVLMRNVKSTDLQNVGNTMFVGALGVGAQTDFRVIFDTGSALTCINSKKCNDIGCRRSHQYDRSKSSTFKEIGHEVEIQFGSGTLQGLINKESIKVGGFQLTNVVFIEITKQIGEAFHEGDFDGIVGLGYPHMTGVPTLFDYLMRQHDLHTNIFTFHLNRQPGNSGSQLVFGGSDDSLIKGEWVYHDVQEKVLHYI